MHGKIGSTNVTYDVTNITTGFTPYGNIVFDSTNGSFYSDIENNYSRLFTGSEILHFTFDQSTQYNLNNWVRLGTFSKGFVFGKYTGIKSKVNVLLNTSSNGYFYYPAEVKLTEGVLYVRLRTLNRTGTNWLGDDSIKYIEIFGFDILCDSIDQY